MNHTQSQGGGTVTKTEGAENQGADADPDALTIEQANDRIAKRLPSLEGVECVGLEQVRGRYLAEDVFSPMPSPPFRASAMDGFAYRFSDAGNTRQLAGESFAGHPALNTLAPGQCVRITTGAKLPDQCDTVVQQENTTLSGSQLLINIKPGKIGHHVRDTGSDCASGSCIANASTRVNAGLIGLCSALGIRELKVHRRLRIALVSTGDELKQAGDTLADGQIYDANTALLRSILASPNVVLSFAGHMRDTQKSVNDTLTRAADEADMIITTGGVSVGARDHLREVMDTRGGVDLWKVAMKPGRPLSFGMLDGKTPWFGLPGNPVSAALTALLFVMPALRQLQGLAPEPLRLLKAVAEDTLTKLPGRVEFQRGWLVFNESGELTVSTTGLQDSHVLSSLSRANCFIRLDIDSNGVEAGDTVKVVPYDFFGSALR